MGTVSKNSKGKEITLTEEQEEELQLLMEKLGKKIFWELEDADPDGIDIIQHLSDIEIRLAEEKKSVGKNLLKIIALSEIEEIHNEHLNKSKQELLKHMFWGDDKDRLEGACSSIRKLLNKKSLQELVAFEEQEDEELRKKEVAYYLHETFKEQYFDNLQTSNYSEEELNTLVTIYSEHFPNLGKGKIMKIKAKSFQKEWEDAFIKEILPMVYVDMDETFFADHNVKDPITTTILDIWFRIDDIIKREKWEIFRHFVLAYLMEHFQKENGKNLKQKEQSTAKPNEKYEEMMHTYHNEPKENKESEQQYQIEAFLRGLLQGQPKQDEIITIIIRLYRNYKGIRASEFIEKYPSLKAIFSDEKTIQQAKEAGLTIVPLPKKPEIPLQGDIPQSTTKEQGFAQKNPAKVNHKKTKTQTMAKIIDALKTTPQKPTNKEKADNDKKIQAYIQERLEIFSAEDCIRVLTQNNYTINNENIFTRNFNELYPTQEDKTRFANEIKDKYQNKNLIYRQDHRSIDLKGGNKILFLKKDTIDGIFEDKVYKKRIKQR